MAHTVGISGLVAVPDTDGASADQTGLELHKLLGSGSNVGGLPYSHTLNITNDTHDITAFASGLHTMEQIGGLNSWSVDVGMRFKKKTGICGNVTFGSGYALLVNQWGLTIATQVDTEATSFASTCPAWKEAIPLMQSWSGDYSGGLDSGTAITTPLPSGAATFRLSDETTADNTLAGSIVIAGASPSVQVGQKNTVSHSFTGNGNLTSAGDDPLFPAGVVPLPTEAEVVFTAASGRTFTGRCFRSNVQITVPINGPIEVRATLQGTGELTVA